MSLTPYDYQRESIEHLTGVLLTRGAAIDGSDTGTGKTLVAVEVMKRLNRPTLVVCPKALRPAWERTANLQGTDISTLNYEMVRTGRSPFGEWRPPDRAHADEWFRWNPAIGFLIFDEGHRCKGFDTQNSRLLKAARRQRIPTLVASATLADTPMEMDALGYLLRLHDSFDRPTLRNPSPVHFYDWARGFGCGGNPFEFLGGTEDMARLNSVLYPASGARVRIKDLGDRFPETQITAELYDLDDPAYLNELYARMQKQLEALHARTSQYSSDPMSIILAERQEAELLKVPIFESLGNDALEQGQSVVFFVNFRRTQEELLARFPGAARIDGTQIGEKGAREREENRLAFQSDRARVIVCISDAGGVGIDLHDITGRYPRAAFISPGFNAKLLRQVFGRVWRAGGLSKSFQRVILAAGTIEEGVHKNLSRKLNNLDALNDGDLFPQNLVPLR